MIIRQFGKGWSLGPAKGGQFAPAEGGQFSPARGWSFCSGERWSFWPFFPVGTLNYNSTSKPYALTSINPSTGLISAAMNDSLTYTSFEKVKTISEGTYTATFTYNADYNRAKMIVLNGSSHVVTRWYPTNRFMKDSVVGTVKKYTYIGGDAYTAPVLAVTVNNGTPTYYYLLRDHLGSITHVVNTSNVVQAEYSYDAWGRMRNPTTWVAYAPGSEPNLNFGGRGFTGHEHLPWFKAINMNGRIYDPLTGQFLSPDRNIQAPGYTQSYNRYGYCLNNPLKYNDPSGEKFRWWHLGLLDILTGGMISATAATKAVTSFGTALSQCYVNSFISNDKAANTWKIWAGLFKTDQNLSINDQATQIISRFTWQDPMTTAGYFIAQGYNFYKTVDVEYFHGSTVIYDHNFGSPNAFSAGGYIFMDRYNYNWDASINDWVQNTSDVRSNDFANSTLVHEYGHYLQTRNWGGVLTGATSFISLMDAWRNEGDVHNKLWVERDANARSLSYFTGRQGFEYNGTNYRTFVSSVDGMDNIRFYDNKLFRWWYLFYCDPIFNTYYNVNNNPR